MIQSPLNYTGGKYRLLPQILPLFPKKIGTFVDLFCGGCNVGVNAACLRVEYNDGSVQLIRLLQTLRATPQKQLLEKIYAIIAQYGLSLVSQHGYDYYGCDSSRGLGPYNKEKFLALRAAYNQGCAEGKTGPEQDILLYVILVYAFNNQIRFNSKGEFNLPVGKRDFNAKMEQKLLDFTAKLQEQESVFSCCDFRQYDISHLESSDFVYADPPYLITCATYNENGGWGEQDEKDLLAFLDSLHEKGVRFALSNVLRSKGRENAILLEWLKRNKTRYRALPLHYTYANASYHTKDKRGSAEEVLVVNYHPGKGGRHAK